MRSYLSFPIQATLFYGFCYIVIQIILESQKFSNHKKSKIQTVESEILDIAERSTYDIHGSSDEEQGSRKSIELEDGRSLLQVPETKQKKQTEPRVLVSQECQTDMINGCASEDKEIQTEVLSGKDAETQTEEIVKRLWIRACGLPNIGNTCFMNAALQCLLNNDVLIHPLLNVADSFKINPKSEGNVAKALEKLLKALSDLSKSSNLSPLLRNLKASVACANSEFSDYGQHDSYEFLKCMLGCISEDLNRVVQRRDNRKMSRQANGSIQSLSEEWYNYELSRENSVITDVFGGQILTIQTCKICSFQEFTFELFWDLSLPFKSKNRTRLTDMIGEFSQEIDIEDVFKCNDCHYQAQTSRKQMIWRLPKVLIIHLQRFSPDFKGYHRKLDTEVVYPVNELDLSEYVQGSKDKSAQDAVYRLCGIVEHSGTVDGGHYTAKCFNFFDRKWYNCNDASVTEINFDQEERTSRYPLLFFYVKSSLMPN